MIDRPRQLVRIGDYKLNHYESHVVDCALQVYAALMRGEYDLVGEYLAGYRGADRKLIAKLVADLKQLPECESAIDNGVAAVILRAILNEEYEEAANLTKS